MTDQTRNAGPDKAEPTISIRDEAADAAAALSEANGRSDYNRLSSMLQTFNVAALLQLFSMTAPGSDAAKLIGTELANRGLDASGSWIGFAAAAAYYQEGA